jgi:hypothetical protein
MSKPLKWLSEVWDDLLLYFVTLLGVLVAQYLPAFKAGQDFDFSAKWTHIAIAAVIALLFVLQDEQVPDGQDKVEVKKGKRRNLRRRLAHGLAQGIAWTTITA